MMRLNPDLIRDILLTVEDECDFSHYLEYRVENMTFLRLETYKHEEITYHINQCKMGNLITNVHYYDNGDCIVIGDLTPQGHEFLENIRDENNWNQTKQYAKKVGSFSLDVLSKIAVNLMTTLIKSQFT